jgi:hypothetical protein
MPKGLHKKRKYAAILSSDEEGGCNDDPSKAEESLQLVEGSQSLSYPTVKKWISFLTPNHQSTRAEQKCNTRTHLQTVPL